ncbi:sugar phosphate isomerase/epimerase [Candidatus Poribacteria bacterium]|nr:sugar phosphate isomerase/epimerase [Candidatus Poribacteria bacterium]MYB64591.1 sugar phosphate isomerase/epimerase [Candidatus Poribacteria bacterium]MYF55717.1 sugar phosphate isomerase/epimerase [Candidatus Poribacteria bacterium]
MRFGICTGIENVNSLAQIGYDYIELGVRNTLMPEADETEFEKMRERIIQAPLKPEAYAGFIPRDLRVVGDAVDFPRLSRYVETACRRCSETGGEVIVYGSSGSRNVEDNYSEEQALNQIAEFLDMAADHAESYGITIVVEPICMKEGNIIRTVADGLAMAKQVNRKEIKVLADLYHIWQESEPMQNIVDAAQWLTHVHIAEPVKRSYPGNDAFDFTDFFTALKKAGYDGRISCECKFDNFQVDAQTALKTMKAYVQ